MKSFKQFINEQLSLDDLDDFGDDFGDDLNLFPDSLSNLKKLSEKDILFYKNLIMSDLEYDNGLAEAGLNNEGIALDDFIEFAFPGIFKLIDCCWNRLKNISYFTDKRILDPSPSNKKNAILYLKKINKWEFLKITDNKIDKHFIDGKLPEWLGYLTNLKKLIISDFPDKNGGLKSLSPGISKLTKLKHITIKFQHNLTELPPTVGNLTNLEMLHLIHSRVIDLPKELSNLTKLKRLSLIGSGLTNVPSVISNFKNLEYLNLEDNLLTEIPKNITDNLNNLRLLYLDDNKITTIFKNLENLNLEHFNIRNNLIPPTEYSKIYNELDEMDMRKSLLIDLKYDMQDEHQHKNKNKTKTAWRENLDSDLPF
jgi:hypothetical protein